MTLQQIDERLKLFKEYLPYKIDAIVERKTASEEAQKILDDFNCYGILFLKARQLKRQPQNFDIFLMLKGREDLIIYNYDIPWKRPSNL